MAAATTAPGPVRSSPTYTASTPSLGRSSGMYVIPGLAEQSSLGRGPSALRGHSPRSAAPLAGEPDHDEQQQGDSDSTATLNLAPPRRRTIFRCQGFGTCEMVFLRSEHLARHISCINRKHTGDKPFECHCGKTFSRLDNLRQHANKRHRDQPEANASVLAASIAVHSKMSSKSMQRQLDAGMVLMPEQAQALGLSVVESRSSRGRNNNSNSPTTESESAATSLAAMAGSDSSKRLEPSPSPRPSVSPGPVRTPSTTRAPHSHAPVSLSRPTVTDDRAHASEPAMVRLPPPSSSAWNPALPAPEAYFPVYTSAQTSVYAPVKEVESALPPTPHSIYGDSGQLARGHPAVDLAPTAWSGAPPADAVYASGDVVRPGTAGGRGVTLPSIAQLLPAPASSVTVYESPEPTWTAPAPVTSMHESAHRAYPYDNRPYPVPEPAIHGPQALPTPSSHYDYRPSTMPFDGNSQTEIANGSHSYYPPPTARPPSSHSQWYYVADNPPPSDYFMQNRHVPAQTGYAPISYVDTAASGWSHQVTTTTEHKPFYTHYPLDPNQRLNDVSYSYNHHSGYHEQGQQVPPTSHP
ncbi:Up in starvation [Microbotryomycetes sp. JL201]|nr:Up in starvation [Microbotryomycetes sp. JL201]